MQKMNKKRFENSHKKKTAASSRSNAMELFLLWRLHINPCNLSFRQIFVAMHTPNCPVKTRDN